MHSSAVTQEMELAQAGSEQELQFGSPWARLISHNVTHLSWDGTNQTQQVPAENAWRNESRQSPDSSKETEEKETAGRMAFERRESSL